MSDVTTEPKPDTHESEPETESGKMSFLEHLDELRKRLVHIVAYIGLGFIVGWCFKDPIIAFLTRPLTKLGIAVYYPKVTDPFTVSMKVACLAGIFLTLPLTLYEVWKFIAPGLYRKEKRYVIPFLLSSMLLFVGGAAFCYLIVLPPAFQVLIQFLPGAKPMIMINDYIDFVNMMLLGFGLIFEMPVIVAFLSLFGLISASFLWNKLKYSLLIIVILAAILSPTSDAFNLILWAAPMIILYIISIGVAAIFGRRRKAKELE
jgi:sec-independent protein translocase protein TatC